MAGVRVTIPDEIAWDLLGLIEADAETGYGDVSDAQMAAWERFRNRLEKTLRQREKSKSKEKQ